MQLSRGRRREAARRHRRRRPRDHAPTATGATLRLALDPALTGQIPADVTARLLPKTLFGERYVELVAAGRPRRRADRATARSSTRTAAETAVELERVLDDALPLLQAIKPDKLAATLGALAYALEGRGDQLGQRPRHGSTATWPQLNEQMPAIAEDVRRLADVLDVYDGALPDLLAILRDVTVTADHGQPTSATQLAAFLADTTDLADATRGFLDRHDDRLIQLGQVSRPGAGAARRLRAGVPVPAARLVALQPRVEQVFATGRMHITLEVTRDNGKYVAGPRRAGLRRARTARTAAACPTRRVPAPQVPDQRRLRLRRATARRCRSRRRWAPPARAGRSSALVKPLVGAATGRPPTQVPDIAVLLWGPLLRGTVVNAS